MKNALKLVVLIGVLLVVFSALSVYRFLNQPIESTSLPLVLEVESGISFSRLADQCHDLEIIQHPLWWKAYARLTGDASRIQAGEYRISSGTTPLQLLQQLVKGGVIQYQLTLVEGWTFAQVKDYLSQQERLSQQLPGMDDDTLMTLLGRQDQHPEGLFFPDTYHYPAGSSDLDILRQALQKMDQVLAAEWPMRDVGLPYDTPYQALIMASIVERETGKAEERPEIAGVFVRRLQQGMRLQTDPTVIYGMGSRFQGNISRNDLRTDTPYNTYTRNGLPPTPIAMPGLASIEAALHPAEGSSLYFVARGDGSHQFSDTLAEHERAVQQYQINQRAAQ